MARKNYMDAVLGLPKSLYLSFYYFPLRQAVKIPILVSRKTIISSKGSRNSVHVPSGNRITIGLSGSFALGGGGVIGT